MKILFITGAYPPMHCGVGDYTARLACGLENITGVTPGVLTSVAAAGSLIRPANFFPVMESWSLPSLSRVIEILRYFRPDVVHLQYPASFGRVLMPNFLPLLCKARGIAMVQTWHEHPIYTQMINALPNDTLVVVDPGYPDAYRFPYRIMVKHKQCITISIGANIPRCEPSQEERRQIRIGCNSEGYRLIAFFGFSTQQKGMEELFISADPERDRLVLISELYANDTYQQSIIHLAESPKWKGKCFITGYVNDHEAASILASADAAVFPFLEGSTPRNGSILGARLQGTFVVTTHKKLRGYNASEHTYYVAPGDTTEIRMALDNYASKRFVGEPVVPSWEEIARRHLDLYLSVLE